MNVGYVDAISVVLFSVIATLFTEGIAWFFVYRKDSYKTNIARVEDLSKKLEREEAITVGMEKRKAQEKKISRLTEDLKLASQNTTKLKFKVNIAVSILFMAVYRLVSMYFYGKVVATLPFDPITFLRGMTHRGIEGENYYDCSFAFIYALCTMSLKSSIQKALGFAPPRAAYDPMKHDKA